MSQYRMSVWNGTLVRQKRRLFRFWMWAFNRSEEDYLNKMKNELRLNREKCKVLARRIPKEEDRLKLIKDGLTNSNSRHSEPIRDSWTPRKEPVRLLEDVKVARPKSKRNDSTRKVKPLLHITPAQ